MAKKNDNVDNALALWNKGHCVGVNFSSLAELKELIKGFDKAEIRRIFYCPVENIPVAAESKRWKGVYNVNRDWISNVVTNRYCIRQHEQAFETLCGVLEDRNMAVTGRVSNMLDVVRIRVRFPELTVTDGTLRFTIGSDLFNSYDYSTMYGCVAGMTQFDDSAINMTAGSIVRNATFATKHTLSVNNEERVIAKFNKHLDEVIASRDAIQKLIDAAKTVNLKFESEDHIYQLLESLVGVRSTQKIMEKYWPKKVVNGNSTPDTFVTKWMLFRILIRYIGYEGVTEMKHLDISAVAEDVILPAWTLPKYVPPESTTVVTPTAYL